MSGWSAALRIARRDARRARGRSALVLAMIALPVLGVVAVDVLARTYELSPEQQASRTMGVADVALLDSGLRSVVQDSGPYGGWTSTDDRPRTGPVDLGASLPPGSRAIEERTSSGRVGVAGRVAPAELHELAYDDPIATGIYAQRTGRAPAGPGEAVLTTALAERLGAGLGTPVELPGGPVTVVGTVAPGDRSDDLAVVLDPGALPTTEGSPRLLVDLPAPVTWDVVTAANADGVVVTLRTPDVPGAPPSTTDLGDDGALTAVGLVVGMALLEVVLLAGPAFAVGAKRQERVLALLSATGADRRDLRRTVLAGGVVLGAVAGVLGALGGVAVAAAALPLLPRWNPTVPGPFEVRLLEVAAVAALGAVTAVAAALLPALLAARQDPLAALTGRRGVRRTSLRVPLAGLAVAAAGTVLALQGARARSVNTVLAGAALAELGLVATTPAVVGLAGRLGPLLPAAPRLALRDAARNRARTAPAVAAVLAAVAGTVAVSTYVSSLDRDNAQRYSPQAAHGALTTSLSTPDPAVVGAATRALEQALPGTPPVVVRSLFGVTSEEEPGWLELVPASDAEPSPYYGGTFAGQYVVGGPDLARAVLGVDARAAAVLERGGALVPAGHLHADGTAVLRVHPPGDLDGTRGRDVVVPAAAVPDGTRQEPVLSEGRPRRPASRSAWSGWSRCPRRSPAPTLRTGCAPPSWPSTRWRRSTSSAATRARTASACCSCWAAAPCSCSAPPGSPPGSRPRTAAPTCPPWPPSAPPPGCAGGWPARSRSSPRGSGRCSAPSRGWCPRSA